MGFIVGINQNNVVKTDPKNILEVNELYTWLDEHSISIKFLGGLEYYIYDDEEAVLFKLRWGV